MSAREKDLELMLTNHANKVDQLQKSIPDQKQLDGIVQGIMAAVDAKVSQAIAASEAKDKKEDAGQLQAVAMMIESALGEIKTLVTTMAAEKQDIANDRKAMLVLLNALAKPRKRSGEVVLPTGSVKMMITEMLDS